MAGKRIEGITIEIGGDVGPLSKALAGVDKDIKNTQANLKHINKLLKLDPTNIELLRQKQEGLSTAIAATKDRLQTLKETNDTVTVSNEKYDAWKAKYAPIQGEITKTENALAKLKKEAKECDEKIQASIKAEAKYNALQDEIQETENKYEALKEKAQEADRQLADGKISEEKYNGIQAELKETEDRLDSLKTESQECERVMNEGKLAKEKYDSLQQEISETENKLESLKQKAKDVTDEFGNPISTEMYDELQREIIETEQDLKKLAQQAAESNTALTKIGEAGKSLQEFGDKATAVGTSLTTHVTAPIVALGTAAVRTTADFDEQMSKVRAISGEVADKDLPAIIDKANEMGLSFEEGATATETAMNIMRAKAREMGAQTKFSATEAGEAYEYMAMAGWKTGDMLEGIEGIMNLAAASGESLGTTSDIVTDALTALGMKAGDAGHFADILAAASTNANTNVSMMGESFKYAAALAGQMGYSAEDVAVSLGLMANAGIKSGQAGRALQNVIKRIVKPTKESGEAIADLNIQTVNADGSAKSWRDIMIHLREEAQKHPAELAKAAKAAQELTEKFEKGEISEDEYNEGMRKISSESNNFIATLAKLSGTQGLSGLLAIVSASEEDFNKLTSAVDNCDGAAENMAKIMLDNLNGQLTILKSALQELMIQIGDALMPTIRKIVSYVQKFVEKLQQMDDGTRNTILRIAALAAAIGPAILAVGALSKTFGKGLEVISDVGKGLLTKFNQIKLGVGGMSAGVIAGIGVLVAAFVHLWKNNEGFRKKMTQLWEKLKTVVSKFVKQFKKDIAELWKAMQPVVEKLKDLWDKFCNALAPVFVFAFNTIVNTINLASRVIHRVITALTQLFNGDFSGALETVKDIFKQVWDFICITFQNAVTTLKNIANIILGYFGTDWETVWNSVSTFMSGIWEKITGFFSNAWETIKAIWEPVGEFFNGIWEALHSNPVLAAITDFIAAPFQAAWNAIRTVWETVTGFFSGIWETIKTALSFDNPGQAIEFIFLSAKTAVQNAWSEICGFFSGIWESIKSNPTLAGIVEGISSFFVNAWNTIKGVWDTVTGFFEGVWTNIKENGVLKGIGKSISDLFTGAKTTIEEAWGKVTGFFEGIWQSITENPTLNAIANTISGFFSEAQKLIEEVWGKVAGFFSGIWEEITKNPTLNGIATSIAGFFETAKTNIENAWKTVSGWFSDIWKTITSEDGLTKIAEKIGGFFEDAWGNVKTAWEGAKGHFEKVWNDITDGEGIKGLAGKIGGFFSTAWTNVENAWNGAIDWFAGIWTSIATNETLTGIANTISGFFTKAWDAIKTAWEGATKFFTDIFDGIGRAAEKVWTTVSGWMKKLFGWGSEEDAAASNAERQTSLSAEQIAAGIENALTGADTSISNPITRGASTAQGAFDKLKTTAVNTATGISNAFKTMGTNLDKVWSATDTSAKKAVDSIRKMWSDMLTHINSVMQLIKTKGEEAFQGISQSITKLQTTTNSTMGNMRTSVINGFTTMKQTVASLLTQMSQSITTTMSSAVRAVQTAMNYIKNSVKFQWSLPQLKLPHITISGSFNLNPPRAPKFSVRWYRKAMENAMLLSSPTIFGAMGNKLLGGGEAGNEVVAGADKLMAMIQSAVSETMSRARYAAATAGSASSLMGSLAAGSPDDATGRTIIAMLSRYLPYLPEVANMKMVTDTGALVGQLAPQMDKQLGVISQRARRQ